MTTWGGLQNRPNWRGIVRLLASFFGLFTGLCTLFALVVTAAEGWVEHHQARWPSTTAHVQRCGVDVYTYGSKSYWIDCSVSYEVRGAEIVSHLHSRTTPAPSRVMWQYPTGRIERMQEWVDEHPEGTPIEVHYDPANPKKAVLVLTDMPLGGPRTPNNLKLLEVAALSCVILVTIARVMRQRSEADGGRS